MKKRIYLTLFIAISPLFSLFATTDTVNYPRIGEKCPDFLLTGVEQFDKAEVTLDDFKGKWLILDFWGEYCVACIRAFPKMNKIQQTFSNNVQVLFIGIPYKDPNTIKNLYESHRKKLNLQIPIVFDNNLADQFAVRTYPHLVVVDPEGIVRYITLSLSKENVQDIIDGKEVTLTRKYNAAEERPYDAYDREVPFL